MTEQDNKSPVQEAPPMKLDVSVRAIEPKGNLLGFANVKFNDCFVVEDFKILQTDKQRLIARRILILKELHGARHTRLECGILIGLANRKSEHRVRVFRKIQQINQSRNIVKQRAENHTAKAERISGRLHRMKRQNCVILCLSVTIAAHST